MPKAKVAERWSSGFGVGWNRVNAKGKGGGDTQNSVKVKFLNGTEVKKPLS